MLMVEVGGVKVVLEVVVVQGVWNLNYLFVGLLDFVLLEVMDNGQFMIMWFFCNQQFLVIFMVWFDGLEVVVFYDVWGEFVVIYEVVWQFCLWWGDVFFCIWNNVYDCYGLDNLLGMVLFDVECSLDGSSW